MGLRFRLETEIIDFGLVSIRLLKHKLTVASPSARVVTNPTEILSGPRPVEWCVSARSKAPLFILGVLEFECAVLHEIEDCCTVHGRERLGGYHADGLVGPHRQEWPCGESEARSCCS